MSSLRIAVIGSSIAGSSCASLLHRMGHRVHVYEAVSQPRSIGAGFLLQPTGMSVLHHICPTLCADVLAHGARVTHLRGTTAHGRVVLDVHYSHLSSAAAAAASASTSASTSTSTALYGVGVSRGWLFMRLHQLL
jgi:2-polyprenyl-6-methoxyphenol hydroxylase-like FAD-dependent oxidoreductase